MKNPKLIAFWKYSNGDFGNNRYCYGEITKWNDNGTVETKEFGQGYYFKPCKVLPQKLALELIDKLENLRTKHNKLDEELKNKKQKELKEVISGLLD